MLEMFKQTIIIDCDEIPKTREDIFLKLLNIA